jgi:hypothetical protein
MQKIREKLKDLFGGKKPDPPTSKELISTELECTAHK